MIRLEIDFVNKTIMFKDSVALSELNRLLSELVIDWQSFTLIPCTSKIEYSYYPPITTFGPGEMTCNNQPYSTFDGPTKL